jgi:hypothetical protein
MKRAILAALLSLLVSSPLGAAAQGRDKQVDFIYFGTPHSPICRDWEERDLPQLKGSPVFQSIRFTTVPKATNAPIPPASEFPADLAPMRDAIATALDGVGAPMFALLVDGQVVAAWKGNAKTPANIIGLINRQRGGPS